MGNNLLGKPASRKHDSKHISTFSTIGSTSTDDHRTFPLRPLNPFAPAFLPHNQFSSAPRISLCNSTAMSLPLAQRFRGMPPPITPFYGSPITQSTTDGTFIIPLVQPKNPSKQDAETLQLLPGFSSLLPSPLQHQAQCRQAIHKTNQQFHQHLKAEQLNRKT